MIAPCPPPHVTSGDIVINAQAFIRINRVTQKCIADVSFQSALVFASENGLKVTVEDAKCVQANAFLQAGIFQEFRIKEEQAIFKINLTVLMVRIFVLGL